MVTAATLARAGRRVLALEAQARVGGRVHTAPFGEGLVELGAEWLTEYIKEHKPDLLKDQDFITEFLEFNNLLTNNYESSNDWNDVSTMSRYESLEGEHLISWHRYGYKTFFDIMLNTYNGGPGLPNLDVLLGREVTRVAWPAHAGARVAVACHDGQVYEAHSVIVTVSLGVLKAHHSTLFSPPLPMEKQIAIEKISIGVMDKIILSFDEVWWPHDVSYFGFIWRGEDRKKVGKSDYWTTRIFGASRPMGAKNCLTMWTSGDVAKEVETLPEDVVKTKCVELLQRFVGDHLKITVPQPSAMTRSTWYSNPFTRGSYSFDNIETPQYPDARAWLGAPLTDSAGATRVLFAGEATHLVHFSTVHGASESGYREAKRLLASSSKI